jgi:hypothetical protein
VRAVRSTGATAALRRCSPVDPAENLLDHSRAGFCPGQFERRLAVYNPQSLPEPLAGLFGVAENILGEGLNPGQANQPVRLLDRQRLLAVPSVPARARGNDKPFDLAVQKAVALHRGAGLLRDPGLNELCEIGFGGDFSAKDAPSAELAIDCFKVPSKSSASCHGQEA